jgi:hypothetical protein
MGHAIKPILRKKVTGRRPEFKEEPPRRGSQQKCCTAQNTIFRVESIKKALLPPAADQLSIMAHAGCRTVPETVPPRVGLGEHKTGQQYNATGRFSWGRRSTRLDAGHARPGGVNTDKTVGPSQKIGRIMVLSLSHYKKFFTGFCLPYKLQHNFSTFFNRNIQNFFPLVI